MIIKEEILGNFVHMSDVLGSTLFSPTSEMLESRDGRLRYFLSKERGKRKGSFKVDKRMLRKILKKLWCIAWPKLGHERFEQICINFARRLPFACLARLSLCLSMSRHYFNSDLLSLKTSCHRSSCASFHFHEPWWWWIITHRCISRDTRMTSCQEMWGSNTEKVVNIECSFRRDQSWTSQSRYQLDFWKAILKLFQTFLRKTIMTTACFPELIKE